MSKDNMFCSDTICNTKIQTTNPFVFQCNICLLPFCSQLCLISHISLTHKENHFKMKGAIIPQSSLYQSNSYYNIENFEKVMENNDYTGPSIFCKANYLIDLPTCQYWIT